jgi:hypothetical protein
MCAARCVAALAALLAAGCAGNPAPSGLVPEPAQAARAVYGGWVEVWHKRGGDQHAITGELIAVSGDSLFVASVRGLEVLPRGRITGGRVVGYDGRPGTLTAASALGSVATLSNGFFLVFTMPLWWIAGGIATHGVVNEMSQRIEPARLAVLHRYARFPQGMPDGVDRATLRMFGK